MSDKKKFFNRLMETQLLENTQPAVLLELALTLRYSLLTMLIKCTIRTRFGNIALTKPNKSNNKTEQHKPNAKEIINLNKMYYHKI